MPLTIKQAISAKTKAGGGTLTYLIKGGNDGEAARDLLLATAPALYNSAPLADYNIDQYDEAWDLMVGTVDYKIPAVTPPQEETGNIYTEFQSTSGTVHISQSLETRGSYCAQCQNSTPGKYIWNGTAYSTGEPGGIPGSFEAGCTEDAPTYTGDADSILAPIVGSVAWGTLVPSGTPREAPYTGGAIGVTKDGIEGVDIEGGPFNFSKRVYLDSITDDQIARLEAAKNCVNSIPWGPFQIGEVRFRGATGGDQGRNNVELTLSFVAEANQTNLTVGQMTGISKMGHEYLWVHYQEVVDPISNTITKRPAYVKVERVYHWSKFEIIDEILESAIAEAWEE